ncbi:MAG TPA: phosphoketolase family protein [Candidatus Paceibacterota bacterium]|nr:phosphoketolase family protein [Candidatus Paceibacterota bacterium]
MREDISRIEKYVRAANYLSAAQIYLGDNFLLKEPLKPEHIKPRLLGHWGTCPGSNFIYANLQNLILKHKAEMLYIMGPGHGYPSIQANLFIEGTLGKYYPEATHDEKGVGYIASKFSWPYGFPSHSNPGAPGVILEGGELGYSLSTAYGAVLDNPDLIVATVVGDGEAETGPMATSWHLNKFVNPAESGAVLPILHLNGYKISGPTIFGRISNKELRSLFYGYGYKPFIVEGRDIYQKMAATMEECYKEIRSIQEKARKGSGLPGGKADKKIGAPRFPMIIMKTPKGWTGIKKLHGEKIEGNCLSHQVVAPLAKTSRVELKALEKWLRSYKFEELFSADNGFIKDIKDLIPPAELRMGDSKHAHGGPLVTKKLDLPDILPYTEDGPPGTIGSSSMRRSGAYLREVVARNKNNFRLFSPDETYSNKLDEVFKETTRAFMWPIKKWDKDMSQKGRVIEMLSEHSLEGLTQGYVLTGRHAIFASYEAFIQIVSSMVDQYAKFMKIAREISWRGEVPSLNFILTSSGWRQEHNGFSHQNPGFIDNILEKHGCFIHVYFPPDGNSTLAVMKEVLESRNEINLIVAGKTLEPRWLTPELAKRELERGLMVWDFASDDNPDIVLSGVGDYLTKEALAAIDIAKREHPSLRIRFVNIMELSALGLGNEACRAPLHDFEDYFTKDKPVIFNFHGYPETLKQVLFDHIHTGDGGRFSVHGYIENGSTTTPYDMQVRNGTSRWHLVKEIFQTLGKRGVVSPNLVEKIEKKYDDKLRAHRAYIEKHGVDPDEIENWQWSR